MIHTIELHIGPSRDSHGGMTAQDLQSYVRDSGAVPRGTRDVCTTFRCSVCDFYTCNPMGYISRSWFQSILDHLKTHGEA